jgi:hypothetical protein
MCALRAWSFELVWNLVLGLWSFAGTAVDHLSLNRGIAWSLVRFPVEIE